MENLLKLKRSYISQANDIRDKSKRESRQYTDEELKQLNHFVSLAKQVDEDIKTAEQTASTFSDLDLLNNSLDTPVPPRTVERNEQISSVSARPAWQDDKNLGYASFRTFILDVKSYSQGNLDGCVNREAIQFLAAAGSDEHSTFDQARGGILVPEGMLPGVLTVRPENSPIAGRTRNIQMNTQSVRISARTDKNHTQSVSGGLRVYRKAEADKVKESQTKLEKILLEAYTLLGATFETEEVLNFSMGTIVSLIDSGFDDEFNSRVLSESLNGTGVGEFLGVNNSPAVVTVPIENNQKAKTIVFQNVLNMRARCWGYEKAVWLANNDTMPQLMTLTIPTGTSGVLLWMPSGQEDHPDLFFGRPIFFTDFTETLGNAGDLLLVNWNEYLTSTVQPIQRAESIHVRFLEHERTFKFWTVNAGAPWWRSALTPKKGADTRSPYVKLAART